MKLFCVFPFLVGKLLDSVALLLILLKGSLFTWRCYFNETKESGAFVLAMSLSTLFYLCALMVRGRASETNKGLQSLWGCQTSATTLSLSHTLSLSTSLSLSITLCTRVSNGGISSWHAQLVELVRKWAKGRVCDAITGNQCGPRNSKEQVSIFQLK